MAVRRRRSGAAMTREEAALHYRTLGRTGLRVSIVSFGCGPVSGWMDLGDAGHRNAVIQRALSAGINWFDTAPGYGNGRSESCLGEALAHSHTPSTQDAAAEIHVATKVRLGAEASDSPRDAVRWSLAQSLERLRLKRVTLLQLHNAVTRQRGDLPFSVTPDDLLRPDGIADAMDAVREVGLTRWLGLTGIGQPESLRAVIASGRFDVVQTPYHLLNPTAGHALRLDPQKDANYGNIIQDCVDQMMGVFSIRVFAGGALLGQPPSKHTLTTPFFPLALYDRDCLRATSIGSLLSSETLQLPEAAVRFALSHSAVSSALVGFGSPREIDRTVEWATRGTLPHVLLDRILSAISADSADDDRD